MPFKSKAQARFMFEKHPKLAKEFAEATPSIKDLPQHKSKTKDSSMKNHHEKHEIKKEHHKEAAKHEDHKNMHHHHKEMHKHHMKELKHHEKMMKHHEKHTKKK